MALTSKTYPARESPLSTLGYVKTKNKKKTKKKTKKKEKEIEKMSQNTITQNSGYEGDPRRNNPPQYNLSPLLPQVEEQEGDEPPPVARGRATRRQPRYEARTEHLEQRIDTLTELVNTLVAVLGQNASNMTPAILPGDPSY